MLRLLLCSHKCSRLHSTNLSSNPPLFSQELHYLFIFLFFRVCVYVEILDSVMTSSLVPELLGHWPAPQTSGLHTESKRKSLHLCRKWPVSGKAHSTAPTPPLRHEKENWKKCLEQLCSISYHFQWDVLMFSLKTAFCDNLTVAFMIPSPLHTFVQRSEYLSGWVSFWLINWPEKLQNLASAISFMQTFFFWCSFIENTLTWYDPFRKDHIAV